jgi:hypothetical protein
MRAPVPAWPLEPFDPNVRKPKVTNGEAYGLVIHPCMTGLGCYGRVAADIDWIETVSDCCDRYGVEQVFSDIVTIMIQTADIWAKRAPEGSVEHQVKTRSTGRLPAPTRTRCRGDGYKWTATDVLAVTSNPVIVGIPPFPAIASRQEWLRSVRLCAQGLGLVQTLVDFLDILKRTYGYPGYRGSLDVPYGYETKESSDANIQAAEGLPPVSIQEGVDDRSPGGAETPGSSQREDL